MTSLKYETTIKCQHFFKTLSLFLSTLNVYKPSVCKPRRLTALNWSSAMLRPWIATVLVVRLRFVVIRIFFHWGPEDAFIICYICSLARVLCKNYDLIKLTLWINGLFINAFNKFCWCFVDLFVWEGFTRWYPQW